MKLTGSCHCQKVRFTVVSHTPYPYMRCYCSICRKTAGGGGYAINIMGDADTMQVTGKAFVSVYRVRFGRKLSSGRRHFCKKCGSALWVSDPSWPELVHPFASAIDTPLPKPPERVHIMLDFKAPWVRVRPGKKDKRFKRYPKESILEWHETRGLVVK